MKLTKSQICWVVVSILLFLFIGYRIFYEKRGIGETKEPSYQARDAYQEIIGFTFTDYSSGKKRMEVKAERASIRPKTVGFFKTPLLKETYMMKPEILFFADGKKSSHITADSARMDINKKRIALRGNVLLITADGKRLSSDEMAVDPKLGLLSIRGKFTLGKNGNIIKGKGLKSDIKLERFVIRRKEGAE